MTRNTPIANRLTIPTIGQQGLLSQPSTSAAWLLFVLMQLGCGPSGLAAGAACDTNLQCSSFVCAVGVCAQACDRDNDCTNSQTCAAQFDSQAPADRVPSVCVSRRAGAEIGQACGSDSDCAAGNCALGRCVRLCGGSGDCTNQQVCTTLYQPSATLPERAYHACLPESGRLQFSVTGDSVALPSSTTALTLFYQSQPDAPTSTVGFSQFVSPHRKLLYQTPVSEADFFNLALRYVPTDSTSTLLFPNSPALVVEPGAYSFALLTPPTGTTSTRLQAFVTLGKAPLASGWTRLRFHIAPLSGSCLPVNATTAPMMLAGYVQEIGQIFAQAAIEIRDVSWRDITGASIIHLGGSSEPNPFVELGERLASATHSEDPLGLDVVVVDKFTDVQGNPAGVLGLAGAIPSSPVGGTPHSGMAVAITSACNQSLFGKVVAHELAHSVGLYHNQERSGNFDALTDTHQMAASNLMYWLQTSGTALSPQQGQVMRNDPKILAP